MFSYAGITYKTVSLWHQTAMGEFSYFEVKLASSFFFLLMFYEQYKNNLLLLYHVSWPGT